jgi:transcription initiation factor IIE alpha subunit
MQNGKNKNVKTKHANMKKIHKQYSHKQHLNNKHSDIKNNNKHANIKKYSNAVIKHSNNKNFHTDKKFHNKKIFNKLHTNNNNKKNLRFGDANLAKKLRKVHTKFIKNTKKAIKSSKSLQIQPKTNIHVREKNIKKDETVLKKVNIEFINELSNDSNFVEYTTQKIGKNTFDIIKEISNPKTDDDVAESLQIKINDVRRTLNLLNTEGMAKYVVNKNNKGWLSFKWYLDEEKIMNFRNSLSNSKNTVKNSSLPENTNDFFICEKCYKKNNKIYSLEDMFNKDFKCDCGSYYKRIDRSEAEKLNLEKDVIKAR